MNKVDKLTDEMADIAAEMKDELFRHSCLHCPTRSCQAAQVHVIACVSLVPGQSHGALSVR